MALLNLPLVFPILILATIALAHDYHADGWRSASGFLRASMDPSKDPCRDFYGHACGRWVNRASREGSDELRDAETKLRDLLLTSLEKIELNSTTANYPNYQRWLRVFYDQCMDLSVMNETELLKAEYRALEHSFEYLFNVTLESSRANARYAVWLTAGYLEQHYLGHLLIETNIDWIMDNCTKRSVLKLSHPSNVDLRISRDQLVEYVKQLYELFGWPLEDEQTATDEADQVKELETKLNELLDKQYDSLNGEDSAKGKLMRYSNLEQEYPGIDWEAYFTGLFPDGWHSRWNETDPLVLVVGDVYFKSIADVLKETRYQILQNYAYWKLIAQIREFYVKKTNEGISGLQTTKEKRSFCYGLLKEFSPAAVARMYFDALRTDPVEWRNDVDLLAHNILSAFRIFVSGQDWLDAQDKMAIVERINGIRIETGIPVWLANETEVNVRTPKFDPKLSTLENVVNSHRLAFMDKIRPLITSGGEAFVEKPPVFTTGARYIYGKIEVYMGQILPPLYHSNYPLAVKYGMLGWLLGHELLHGFDQASLLEGPVAGQRWLRSKRKWYGAQPLAHPLCKLACLLKTYHNPKGETLVYGSTWDPSWTSGYSNPNLNWALNASSDYILPKSSPHDSSGNVEKMFHQRKRCMVKQYSTYCYKQSGGQCLSGVRTVNENIGDIEGLKIAYMAYKFVTQTIGSEPPIPELVKLSSDQAFFISAAQLHCGKEYSFILTHEEHPPNKVRVEQSMRNFPIFAQAFKCRKGSKFSPIRTCSLWGRFVSPPNQCEESTENGGWEW